MASRQELLESIQPCMKLTKNFFMRIYGYGISFPGFAEAALEDLGKAGYSKARAYYQRFVGEYEKKHDKTVLHSKRACRTAKDQRKQCLRPYQADKCRALE